MKKMVFMFISVASIITGCAIPRSLVQTTFPYTSNLVIHASNQNKVPMEAISPVSSFDQIFTIRGSDPKHVNEIRVVSAKIEASNPNHSLGIFKSIKMYLSVGEEGSNEVLVASRNNISPHTGSSLTLNIDLDKIVEIGYGSAKRKDITGSIVSLDADEIKDGSVSRVDQAILGKLAGVQVVGNGEPGAASQIRIRGISSFLMGGTPLYVVDGFPVDNIQMLNPNDIESIDVLKDASVTSIYGSRGANGVILIKTKSGNTNSNLGFLDDLKGSKVRIRLEYMLRAPLRTDTGMFASLSFNSGSNKSR